MVTLGIGIGDARPADPQHFLQHFPVSERGSAQLRPIAALAASDHVVNRGEGELVMGEMTMQHGSSLSRSIRNVNSDFWVEMREGRTSFGCTFRTTGASVLVAGGTKGLSALGAFLEASRADDVELIIADRIPATGIEAGFARQGIPFFEHGIIGYGKTP